MKIKLTKKLVVSDAVIYFSVDNKAQEKSVLNNDITITLNKLSDLSEGVYSSFTNGKRPVYVVSINLKKKDIEVDTVRRMTAKAVKIIKKNKLKDISVVIPSIKSMEESFINEVIESFILTTYKFDKYISKKDKNEISSLTIVSPTADSLHKKLVDESVIQANYTNFTKDLVNTPPTDLNPSAYERIAKREARIHNLKVKVFDSATLKNKGMNCLSGVSDGSSENSRMVFLEYKPKKCTNKKPIVFVGKGITYDAGGINIKPSGGGFLDTMKDDMGGSAAVLSAILAASKMKLNIHIISILSIAENMVGESAYKPGDILKAYNGKTVEVKNTDAEGRLALADGLSYASKHLNPDCIIDVATLTGASIVSLGWDITPFLGNDSKLKERLKKSSVNTGEKIWELPLDECYLKYMKGDISDLKNITDGMNAGVNTAAIFLNEFVDKKIPWVHFDIGGTVMAKRQLPYESKGATGSMTRLLIDFLKKY